MIIFLFGDETIINYHQSLTKHQPPQKKKHYPLCRAELFGGWGLIFVVWIDRFFCWGASICLEGGSFSSRSQRSRGLGIARVRGRRGGRDAPEAPPLVIAEADAALSAQRLRSDVAVETGR